MNSLGTATGVDEVWRRQLLLLLLLLLLWLLLLLRLFLPS